MRFVLHNRFNNSSYLVSSFETPETQYVMPQSPVVPTKSGIVFINCDEAWDSNQRIAFASKLHAKLSEEFNAGLSATTYATSDCTFSGDFSPYFAAIKSIDPAIITIQVESGKRDPSTADLYIPDRFQDTRTLITQHLGITDEDRKVPPLGWEETLSHLNRLYNEIESEINAFELKKNVSPASQAHFTL